MSDCKHEWFYDKDYRECNICEEKNEYAKLCMLMQDYIDNLEAKGKETNELVNQALVKRVEELEAENKELKEMLTPFGLHAKALTQTQAGVKYFRDNDQMCSVYRHGVSGLSWGLFNRVLDWFESKEASEK